jgi:hypothetical protein
MDHSPVLDGTLPVMPFDPLSSSFLGAVSGGSGTPPSVLALAAEADGTLVLLNTVGYQTACSAHFARLWQNESISFQPTFGVRWDGPTTLRRSKDWSYQEIGTPLKDTPFVNALGLTRQANIDYGLKVPPAFPTEAAALTGAAHAPVADEDGDEDTDAPPPVAKSDMSGAPPRFIFGNLHESTPAPAALHGHLRALRIVRLYDTSTPEAARCTRIWVEQLWLRGLACGLTRPLSALGLRAWRLSGDLTAWAELVRDGLSSLWLPRPQ